MTLILSNEDIDQLLTMADYVDILEDAYGELAAGRGVVRPRADSLAPTAMPGAVYGLKSADGIAPKFGAAAVRINSDIITYPEVGGVPRRVKVPAAPNKRWVGLVLLFSTETGEPLAIFPDGAMQRMRVGATSGLGAKFLAREDASTAAIIGSGFQAGAQLMALAAVRDIQTVRCFSPNRENRERFCRDWSERLQIDMTPVAAAEDAVKGADVVACSTSSLGYVFHDGWLEPGMHISSIKLPEIDPAEVNRADLGGRLRHAAVGVRPDRGPRPGPHSGGADDLFSEQHRHRLPIRRLRRGRLSQGEGNGIGQRAANRLVYRGRASVTGGKVRLTAIAADLFTAFDRAMVSLPPAGAYRALSVARKRRKRRPIRRTGSGPPLAT
jgi:ornithine cyclodeaminase/alanine dehydrogenase-like protein (mu-crystallin family)